MSESRCQCWVYHSRHLQPINGVTLNNERAVDFSCNGELLVSSGEDQTIKLWDVDTDECLHTFLGHEHMVKTVRFSPDGSIITSGVMTGR